MRRVLNWILFLLAVAAAAAGAAEQAGMFVSKVPPPAFAAIAGVLLLLLIIRILPLGARRVVVFLVVFVALAGLIGGLSYFQFVVKPQMLKTILAQAFAPKPTAVNVDTAKYESWPPQLSAIGTLRAYQGIVVAPQVAGIVTGIHFESGDNVKEGQLLISIDDSVEQADLANGIAQLRNANATLERQKTLVAGGNTPQSSVDTAVAARDGAAAAVERTKAIIAQKAIRAPFAGKLGLRNVDLGQFVSVGTSLTTLQRLDPIYVDFQAPEGATATLAVGQPLTIAMDALPGREFQGKVTAVDARVSAESRNVTARAEFANPDGKLLPGMFANVMVTLGAPAKVLAVPRTAIVYSLYGNNVFVVKKGADSTEKPEKASLTVERRFVKTGAARGEFIGVDSGLDEGEQVVTAGQVKLQNNSQIVIDPTSGLPPPAQTPKP